MAATGAACGSRMSIRAARFKIMASVDERGPRPVLPLAHGDPSVFPAFRTAAEAEDAVADALRTGEFNCYPAGVGLPDARRNRKPRKNTIKALSFEESTPQKATREDVLQDSPGVVSRRRLAMLMGEGSSEQATENTTPPATRTAPKITPRKPII